MYPQQFVPRAPVFKVLACIFDQQDVVFKLYFRDRASYRIACRMEQACDRGGSLCGPWLTCSWLRFRTGYFAHHNRVLQYPRLSTFVFRFELALILSLLRIVHAPSPQLRRTWPCVELHAFVVQCGLGCLPCIATTERSRNTQTALAYNRRGVGHAAKSGYQQQIVHACHL